MFREPGAGAMNCKRCGVDNQSKFPTEMNVHFAGWEGLDKPSVWVFPEVLVCLNCGLAEFDVPVRQLAALVDGSRTKAKVP
jgi:hypothetical protein